VIARFFEVLGVVPVLGRPLLPTDATATDPRPLVISYGVWQGRCGGDPAVLNRVVDLDGRLYAIVGVMPRAMAFPYGTNAWVLADEPARFLTAVVRLPPDGLGRLASPRQALTAEPLTEFLRPGAAWSVVPVFVATLMIGLIALTHFVGLEMARGVDEMRETAVRTALGASRTRLAAGWATEYALVLATALTLAVVSWPSLLAAVVSLLPEYLTDWQPIAPDFRALLYLLALALVAIALLVLARVVVTQRANAVALLHARPGRSSVFRAAGSLRWLLLGTQIAVVSALVSCGGLAWRSYTESRSAAVGFDMHGLITIDVDQIAGRRSSQADQEAVLERLQQLHGVRAVAFGRPPFRSGGTYARVESEPASTADATRGSVMNELCPASPEYFHAVGVPLLSGRPFGPDDRFPAVAIISRSVARRIAGDDSALNRSIYVNGSHPTRVIGIVGDVWSQGPDRPPVAAVYYPAPSNSSLVIRVEDKGDVVRDVRAVVAGVTRAQAVPIAVEEDEFALLTTPQRSRAVLLGVLAALALAIGTAGVAAASTEAARRQQRDAAVRIALGAPPSRLARRWLTSAAAMAGVSALLGLLLGAFVGRWMSAELYGVRPVDATTAGGAWLLLLGCTVGGTLRPALRLSQASPIALLRDE
jgi:putative ABC transport system permease protein